MKSQMWDLVAGALYPSKAYNLPSVCERYGVEPGTVREHFLDFATASDPLDIFSVVVDGVDVEGGSPIEVKLGTGFSPSL
ncbi:MAG: hypothetical protein WBX11_04800 [Thiobacillaceae bacterium]